MADPKLGCGPNSLAVTVVESGAQALDVLQKSVPGTFQLILTVRSGPGVHMAVCARDARCCCTPLHPHKRPSAAAAAAAPAGRPGRRRAREAGRGRAARGAERTRMQPTAGAATRATRVRPPPPPARSTARAPARRAGCDDAGYWGPGAAALRAVKPAAGGPARHKWVARRGRGGGGAREGAVGAT